MINLPKPSANIDTITYLSRLVRELDRILNINDKNTSTTTSRVVKDIGLKDGQLVVRYSDNATKYIEL